jgi:hypothetical protein
MSGNRATLESGSAQPPLADDVGVPERLRLTSYVGNVSLFFIALAIVLAGLTDWLVNLS